MADFLFDIGNVLLAFDFEPSMKSLVPSNHPNPAQLVDQLLAKKNDFESGKISVSDYTKWALHTLESSASEKEFHSAWQNIFTPNFPMWEVVQQLHSQGHRLILFSNINGIHAPWIFEQHSSFSLFHGAVLSHEVGSIKPEASIYEYAIREYGLTPERTYYIDDLPANIRTGKELGFLTHQYRLDDHAAFEAWLSKHLVS